MNNNKETCNGCGSPVNPTQNKCSWCGRFHVEPPALPTPILEAVKYPTYQKKKIPFWILLGCGCGVIAGVAGLYFYKKIHETRQREKKISILS